MNKIKLTIILLSSISLKSFGYEIPTSSRAESSITSVELSLKNQLAQKNLVYGAPIFIRIFKDPGILEMWIESKNGTYINFKNYNICKYSGYLGPKLKEGDKQSPEGFYVVTPDKINPLSRFHLSFNLGYPNQYDKYHGRTGSALMVHGNCMSIGCYAMTDQYIDEIYALVVSSFRSGHESFSVHSFPFKLESETLSAFIDFTWHPFWLNLKDGYDYFNKYRRPPSIELLNGKYVILDKPQRG